MELPLIHKNRLLKTILMSGKKVYRVWRRNKEFSISNMHVIWDPDTGMPKNHIINILQQMYDENKYSENIRHTLYKRYIHQQITLLANIQNTL